MNRLARWLSYDMSRRSVALASVVLAFGILCGAPFSAEAAERWIPGDLHAHVSPPDTPDAVTLDAAAVARLAHDNGLEFVILTPHLWPKIWNNAESRARFVKGHREMAVAARAEKGVTLIPGVEFGVPGVGHFGVSGFDLDAIPTDGDFLPAARAHGAFIVLNHPFAVPTHIPGIKESDWDASYRPWTQGGPGFSDVDAVEVWNVPLSLANLVSRPGGKSGEERAFIAADERARKEHRPVVVVGGSDNHKTRLMPPTTWVLAPDTSEASILAALRAGKTCVGGPEAGSLTARGDLDPADRWVPIGGRVTAARSIQIQFSGEAQIFVDGVDRGIHASPFEIAADRSPHTVRIVVGKSRSGFIYANL